jgi:hypothetical protein
LSAAPFLRFAFPAGGQLATNQPIGFFALSGDGQLKQLAQNVAFPSSSGTFWSRRASVANSVPLISGDLPEAIETDNNDSRETATELPWPLVMNGQLESKSDEDWYRIDCRAGKALAIGCSARPGWSSALPIISLVDGQGNVVSTASAVQALGGTPRLHWQPPADGTWWLRVRDLQQGSRGGPDFTYRLTVRDPVPDFLLSAKADVINVVQGARTDFDIAIEHLGGFTGPIELIADGLPEGVSLEGNQVAPGQALAKLAFVATEEARSCDVTLRIKGRAEIAGAAVERPIRATHLGHDLDGVGVGSTHSDHVQLTVVHKPVFRLYCNEAYQYAHRGTVYPYLMEVERLNGFEQPIHLEVADRQIKDLDGIEIPETSIAPDQSQFTLPLYLPETMHINVQAHSNVYAQGHVEFVDKFGQSQTMLVVSTMRCMVRTLPTVVKLRSAERELVASDGTAVCSLALDRTPNFQGSMQITLVDPVSGISAEAVTIGAKETSVEMSIRISTEKIQEPSSIPLRFRAVGKMEGDVQVVSETTVLLIMEPDAR